MIFKFVDCSNVLGVIRKYINYITPNGAEVKSERETIHLLTGICVIATHVEPTPKTDIEPYPITSYSMEHYLENYFEGIDLTVKSLMLVELIPVITKVGLDLREVVESTTNKPYSWSVNQYGVFFRFVNNSI